MYCTTRAAIRGAAIRGAVWRAAWRLVLLSIELYSPGSFRVRTIFAPPHLSDGKQKEAPFGGEHHDTFCKAR